MPLFSILFARCKSRSRLSGQPINALCDFGKKDKKYYFVPIE
jgi:hypothetical protein